MICMSITTRRNSEYKSSLAAMSVIKAVSVSCNYNFGNASLEYICLKIAQVYCSIPCCQKGIFKPVLRTLVITGLKEVPNRTKCIFFILYLKLSQDTKLNTGVLDTPGVF